jgi:SpoVK/Ycf46/Vps4 family AAA+-type ATPase
MRSENITQVNGREIVEFYTTSLQHLLAELERIDLLIQAQVFRARQLQTGDDQFRGLYLSEQEVDTLLAQPNGLPCWATAAAAPPIDEIQAAWERLAAEILQRKTASRSRGITLRLEELAQRLELTPLDVDILLICLAPELDLRYERLYAYLQDDVTRKRASVDLVLNLLCNSLEAKIAARQRFDLRAPLLAWQVVQLFDDPAQQRSSLLAQYLKADRGVVDYLLGNDQVDTRLRAFVRQADAGPALEEPSLPLELTERLGQLVVGQAPEEPLILYLQGPDGVGKQATAATLCRHRNLQLLVVEGQRLVNASEPDFPPLLDVLLREARLQGAAVYWDGFDALLSDSDPAKLERVMSVLAPPPGLTFLTGNTPWEPDPRCWPGFFRIEFPLPDYGQRLHLWTQALAHEAEVDSRREIADLANQFRFSGGQILAAVATARHLARWRDSQIQTITMKDLYAACRRQSNQRLEALAHKVTPHYTWGDIVLPPDRLEQLRDICNRVKHRALVYDHWGFNNKLALGKGLNVLFSGPSGTGKTMAAEVIAGELGLDLYKLDLASIVSKYIGETEKNLAQIFTEAETSNAILFFDEADALFGKRSEVKDAHDRYANIEISYLLQRMEAYEGVVILATNLRRNMDDAFVRRLAFAVTFPFPEEEDRLRIWKGVWPHQTPRADDLDLPFMARQFKLTGGNIKNIALAAAFLAAEEGGSIMMRHLIGATRRELQKMGKACVETDFGCYSP